MSSVVISGDTSGAITLAAPAVAGTNTITLPALTGTTVIAGQNSAITAGTAVASTSGTSIDFTSIPSWVKRITVMFNAVSTNGTSNYQVQIGDSGGIRNTGYASTASGTSNTGNVVTIVNFTAGFGLTSTISAASTNINGIMTICLLNATNNLWAANGSVGAPPATYTGGYYFGGSKALSATLDRIRITTINGTDTFNSGTINILYE